MNDYRFIVEYDGTDFEGWQAQPPGHRTVQGSLSEALERLCSAPVVVTGSGRTDAGVHAPAQVASARLATRLSPDELRRALDASLPEDLVVRSVALAPDGFDARRDAVAKCYRYTIWNHPVRSPLRARHSWWVRRPLDLAAIDEAAGALRGEHDFASFQAAGSNVTTTVRKLLRVGVDGRAGGRVELEFEADGFLRYMVRNLVGTLVEVGHGRRRPTELREILEARDRGVAGPTAPARGLSLISVRYPDFESAAVAEDGG